MQQSASEASTKSLRTGMFRAAGGLFLSRDGGMKLFKPQVVVRSRLRLGDPESTIARIGAFCCLRARCFTFSRAH